MHLAADEQSGEAHASPCKPMQAHATHASCIPHAPPSGLQMFLLQAPASSDYLLASLTYSAEAAAGIAWFMYARMEAARAALQLEGQAVDAIDRSGARCSMHMHVRMFMCVLACLCTHPPPPTCPRGQTPDSPASSQTVHTAGRAAAAAVVVVVVVHACCRLWRRLHFVVTPGPCISRQAARVAQQWSQQMKVANATAAGSPGEVLRRQHPHPACLRMRRRSVRRSPHHVAYAAVPAACAWTRAHIGRLWHWDTSRRPGHGNRRVAQYWFWFASSALSACLCRAMAPAARCCRHAMHGEEGERERSGAAYMLCPATRPPGPPASPR
jgi:hypothetical protein